MVRDRFGERLHPRAARRRAVPPRRDAAVDGPGPRPIATPEPAVAVRRADSAKREARLSGRDPARPGDSDRGALWVPRRLYRDDGAGRGGGAISLRPRVLRHRPWLS